MDHKLTITIRIIAYIIASLFLISAIWYGYENLRQVRASTNDYTKGVNEVIIEWSADYAKDKELLDKIDNDLKEAQLRLEKLGVEFD